MARMKVVHTASKRDARRDSGDATSSESFDDKHGESAVSGGGTQVCLVCGAHR
jgi:hypothetical protein